MAKYKRIVTTEAGLQLLAAAVAGGTVTFTAVKTGSGVYSGTEDLSTVTDLKSVRQTFSVSSVTRTDAQVKLRSLFSNDNLTEGYSMTEIGIYAKNPSTGTDFLYAIIVAELADYLPAYDVVPTSITMELYIELTEAESGVTFTAEVIEGAYVPVESFNEHVTDKVIHITAAERSTWNAKLAATGNVSNTTAAFTEASTLAALATGSKLSVLFGALAKAVSSLISHLANKSNPHSVTKAQLGLGSVDNTSDLNKPVSTAMQTELNKKALAADLSSHTGSTSNPHSVTKTQVGLGNVPNVATNDQTPSYTAATSLTALTSGEKLSVAFGKLSKAVSDLISHLANKSNPHGVTKAQVGLGSVDNTSDVNKPVSAAVQAELDKKALAADLAAHIDNTGNPHSVTKAQVGLSNVPNVATNDQTPTYTVASSLTALASGEKLSVAFGKLSKAVSDLISHLADSVKHITAAERTAWNAKLDATATAVDADKLDGLHAGDFALTKNTQLKLFNGVDDLGLTTEATLPNVWNAMPNGSVLIMDIGALTDASWNFPNRYGVLTMVKAVIARGYVYFDAKEALNERYYMVLTAGGTPDGIWRKKTDGGNADTLSGYHASDFPLVKNTQINLFNKIADIGLTTAATLAETWAALPANSLILIDAISLSDSSWNLPENIGLIVMCKSVSDSRGYIEYKSKGEAGLKSFMVFNSNGSPTGKWHTELNTGNSAPVIISSTAPTNTGALWVDTAVNRLKIYKNGAWTALS